jgi:hypothetical protein
MATVWDIQNELDAAVVETQRTTVRPSARKTACFTVIAVATGALFCLSNAAIGHIEEGVASASIIGIERVPRTDSAPKKPVRREREQYAPDALQGLSTHRLAQTFGGVFVPVEEDSASVDFNFG